MTNKDYMMTLDETRAFLAKANLPEAEEVATWMNNEFKEDDEFWCAVEVVANYLAQHKLCAEG